jgi:hypothetical protein
MRIKEVNQSSRAKFRTIKVKIGFEMFKRKLVKFRLSNKALAIPVTFFMLFVSLFTMVSITYYFAVSKVNVKSQTLKISAAKQNMDSLEESLQFVVWQPSSSKTFEFDDCGGTLKTEPSTNRLLINITDGITITDVIFNASVGGVRYELPYSQSVDTGLYLKGDSRVVVNQSGSVMTQLYIESGEEHPEIRLRYRPIVSSVDVGTENGKPVNNVRIYTVNLNSSQNLELMGKVPLKFSCLSVETSVNSYNVSYSLTSLIVKVILGGLQGQVSVPISSNANGAIINVELVVCNIKVEWWAR